MKYEISFNWGLAFALAWGICWRGALVGFIPGYLLSRFLATSSGSVDILIGAFFQIALMYLGMVITIKWLFGSGRLGSLKLLFMEQAHYQELASNPALQRDAPQAARP